MYKFFSGKYGKVEIEINLKKLFGLLVVVIFLIAIDPVPAGIAIAAAFWNLYKPFYINYLAFNSWAE